jgi:thioredoxin 1
MEFFMDRLLILLVVIGTVALASRPRLARLRREDAPAGAYTPLHGVAQPGKPALLYFTTEQCAQCKYQQAPILEQLGRQVDVAIHKLDAIEQEALTRLFGIMTVPATVVLDAQLKPVAESPINQSPINLFLRQRRQTPLYFLIHPLIG